jgi:hypothetical protein
LLSGGSSAGTTGLRGAWRELSAAGSFGVLDLTTGGVGLISPVAIDRGAEAELTLDLRLVDGRTQSTHLVLTVTECRSDGEASDRWRIGGTVTPRTDIDRTALVEDCHVVATRARLQSSGRLQAGTLATPTAYQPSEAVNA